MSDAAITHDVATEVTTTSGGFSATIFKNIIASLARVTAVSLVALVLPAYLIQHLSVQTYAAWVLIIQLGAYVSYLDLGIQTAVAKFVAEYDARRDWDGAGRHASAGFVLMLLAGLAGVGLTFFLAWRVPHLFKSMPANLYRDVRISLMLVGSSLSFSLVCAVYSAVFLGLQRYWVPTTITIINRISFAGVVLAVVALRGSLVAMGLGVAIVNVVAGFMQVMAWHRKASYVRMSLGLVKYGVLKNVARFCSLQSIWTTAMLCISGLDIAIVGHYDYLQTAYYSIATMPTQLRIADHVFDAGAIDACILRHEHTPLIVGDGRFPYKNYPLHGGNPACYGFTSDDLRLHSPAALGRSRLRASQSQIPSNSRVSEYYSQFVRAVRNHDFCHRQTGSSHCDRCVRSSGESGQQPLPSQPFRRRGRSDRNAAGFLRECVPAFCDYHAPTRQTLAVSRSRLFVKGLLHPAIIALPSLVLVAFWQSPMMLGAPVVTVWGLSTLILAWFGALNGEERRSLLRLRGKWRLLLIKA